MTGETQEQIYDVIIIGGGPAGLAVGSELSRLGHKILIIEKNEVGITHRSWLVPGQIIAKLEPDVQQFAYNGVKRFLEYTSDEFQIKWDAAAPWDVDEEWKRYPYIRQKELLTFWADRIKSTGSEIKNHCMYLDYSKENDITTVQTLSTEGNETRELHKTRLLIDASGNKSELAKANGLNRDGYFYWSVFGYEIEFDDVTKVKHPGKLGNMEVGDYMLWYSQDDFPLNKDLTLAELRPVIEYEVLDENRIFMFILFFTKEMLEYDYMKSQYDYIMKYTGCGSLFEGGKTGTNRYGWYPSNSVSQKLAKDHLAFIGDAGCWTAPDGFGMSFVLNNYQVYSKHIHHALNENKLDADTLNKATEFNTRQKYNIMLDKLVMHFLAYAPQSLINRFTNTMFPNGQFNKSAGKMIELMFCLDLTEEEAIENLKQVFKAFTLKELHSVFKDKGDYELLLEVGKEFIETSIIDKILSFLGFKTEKLGFEFKE